jgi:hypothetical protein
MFLRPRWDPTPFVSSPRLRGCSHVTSEITAAIADKVGGLYWGSTPDDGEEDDGSAGGLAAVLRSSN